jgi:hypothetical protein
MGANGRRIDAKGDELMTREEVIKGLDCCTNNKCDECPYIGRGGMCFHDVKSDALKLIEQDRESEIVTVVDKYHTYYRDDLMESFYGFIRTEVEWFLGQDATYADSSMHHIAGAVSLLQTILKSGESLVRKEKPDA